jgi:hypothetical protein
MSTPAPDGMPLGHAVGWALPRATFTIVMSSLTVTVPLASQSPVHGSVMGVGCGVSVLVRVGVGVRCGVAIGVLVGTPQPPIGL